MKHSLANSISKTMERIAVWTTNWVGSSWAFLTALALTAIWLIAGPFFHYSDTWQLLMNTASSIVTFLMVFLLQRSQNKESLAIQVKLNELLASQRGASNRLINIEELSEEEVRKLHQRYQQLVDQKCAGGKTTTASSIEDIMKPEERNKALQKQDPGFTSTVSS